MSMNPIENPAELNSSLPNQILILISGFILVLVESALAQWNFFYASTPLLTIGFIYYLSIFHKETLPLFSVFLLGLFSEIIFSDILGSKSTIFSIVALFTSYRSQMLIHADFVEIWSNFSLMCIIVSLFQILIYFVFYFDLPSINLILYQSGMTILLFPLIFVLLLSLSSFLIKISSYKRLTK